MPMPKKSDQGFIIGTARGLAEKERLFRSDDDLRSASKTLLKPDEVAGEYDISRKLMTTLSHDGKPVMLTHDHLRQFAHISRQAAAKLKKGVTAQAVIDLSLPVDRERANEEIRSAVPVSTFGHQVKFMTNAGPNSDRTRHYVTVNFLSFMPVVASAIKVDKAGKELSKSPLQISCSCGRWRYWLAFLATKAGYNSGHAEDAFPKIRNPGLSGIACKHILRVMVLIRQSPFMTQYLTTMVRKAREKVETKRADEKVADTRTAAEAMKNESWRQRQITTSEQRKAESDKAKERREAKRAASRPATIKKVPPSTRRLQAMIDRGEITQRQIESLRKKKFSDAKIVNFIEAMQEE